MSTILIPELKERRLPAGYTIGGVTFVLAALSWIGPFSIDTYLPSFFDRPSLTRPLPGSSGPAAFLLFAVMSLWHGAIRRLRTPAADDHHLSIFSRHPRLHCVNSTLMFFRVATARPVIVGRAIVRDLFDGAAAQRLMSHVATLFTIAPVLAPVIGGWFQIWFGWRSIFVFLVLLSAFLVASCWRALPETLPREQRQRLEAVFLARSYWRVLTTPAFMLACGSMAFTGLLHLSWGPTFLMKHLDAGTHSCGCSGPVRRHACGAWIWYSPTNFGESDDFHNYAS
jgi:DHA1 family bicyclomycin/chloramphenicol resistance-like MFS transporter